MIYTPLILNYEKKERFFAIQNQDLKRLGSFIVSCSSGTIYYFKLWRFFRESHQNHPGRMGEQQITFATNPLTQGFGSVK